MEQEVELLELNEKQEIMAMELKILLVSQEMESRLQVSQRHKRWRQDLRFSLL